MVIARTDLPGSVQMMLRARFRGWRVRIEQAARGHDEFGFGVRVPDMERLRAWSGAVGAVGGSPIDEGLGTIDLWSCAFCAA